VFIVENGKAQQRRIGVGLTNDGLVEVTDGLKGQEQVVVVGQGGLKTGNTVRVVELESPATAR
jgi:multidrug efflux pump subunit AcrA (membrane-fusion protein)